MDTTDIQPDDVDVVDHGEGSAGVERRPSEANGSEYIAYRDTSGPDTDIENQAFHDPSAFVRALTPLIGRTVRRALFEKLHRLVVRLNYQVLRHISLTGLSWRWQAYRSGRTFDEVLAEHRVLSRVDQVFLIHRESGLLLAESRDVGKRTRDGDMMSGMLTAIQDFVRDSFALNDSEQLDSIQVGDVTVWVEQGPKAVLAAVVTGAPPLRFRAMMRSVLRHIHAEFSRELREFSGDPSPLRRTRAALGRCLVLEAGQGAGRILPTTWLIIAIPIVAGIAWVYTSVSRDLRWRACLREIASRPGLVITDTGKRGGKYYVAGLRDPLAVAPLDDIIAAGFNATDVVSRWEPYQSLDPELLIRRVRRTLEPPKTVMLKVSGNTLSAFGTARESWITEARQLAARLPGIARFDTTALVRAGETEDQRWNAYIAALRKLPGIIVISEDHGGGAFSLVGMRDPLAADPIDLLERQGFDPRDVDCRWSLYPALDEKFILARAREKLAPPPTVTLSVKDGVLHARGRTPHLWITQAQPAALAVAGVRAFDTTALVDEDMALADAVRNRIEQHVLKFLIDTPDLWPGQGRKISSVAASIKELEERLDSLDKVFVIEVRGHVDASGSERKEIVASEQLARRAAGLLTARDVDARMLKVVGLGASAPTTGEGATDDPYSRYVSFKVVY